MLLALAASLHLGFQAFEILHLIGLEKRFVERRQHAFAHFLHVRRILDALARQRRDRGKIAGKSR